jgi:hypothetical protein
MTDQRLPLAFAALQDTRHCEERDSATKQSSARDASSPALDCFPPDLIRGPLAMTVGGIDPQRTALILTGVAMPTGTFAVVRHAGSAAQAQAGACNCCRVPSDLVTVLRRLVIDRARGDIDISAVLVTGAPADLTRLAQDALADPFVAARYVVHRAA